MSHNRQALAAHIVELSEAETFDEAVDEWDFTAIEFVEEGDHCPCGQHIHEQCFITNRHNGNTTYVGNVCINRFMGMDTKTLVAGLHRIQRDECANPNEAVIEYANARGYLFPKEYDFLIGIHRKRNFSTKQQAWKEKINRRILNQVVVRRCSKRP